MERINIPKGEMLIKEGEESSDLFYLITGKLRTFTESNGERITLGSVKEGAMVGELSFLDNRPRSANVEAVVDCELIRVPREEFQQTMEQQPEWLRKLIVTLVDRLRESNRLLK